MFSLKARNVFKKARSLFSFPAEEDEGEGKKPSDDLCGGLQTLGLNRAVVAAELCGRWGRIVRSLRPDRAVAGRSGKKLPGRIILLLSFRKEPDASAAYSEEHGERSFSAFCNPGKNCYLYALKRNNDGK
jgi:hypothetical protein